MSDQKLHPDTLAIHAGQAFDPRTGAVSCDVARLLEEIESLSAQVSRQQRVITSIEQGFVQLNAAVASLEAELGRFKTE